MSGDDLEARLRAAILAYVAEHRHAADTADGIACWWPGALEATAGSEVCVLEQLVEEGQCVRRQGPDGATLE